MAVKKKNYLCLKGRRLQANKHSTEVTVGQYRYRELDIIDTGIGCFDTDKAGRTCIKLDESGYTFFAVFVVYEFMLSETSKLKG